MLTENEDTPFALTPLYKGNRANQPIILYQGQIRAKGEGFAVEGEGQVTLSWHPSQRIALQIETSHLPPKTFGQHMQLELVGLDVTVYGDLTEVKTIIQTGQPADVEAHYDGVVSPTVFINPRDTALDEDTLAVVVFHVTNLPQLGWGDAIRNEDRMWLGRTVLEAHGWRFTIDQLMHYQENSEQLNAFGGFSITHVGSAKRADGEPFSINSAQRLLSRLSLYLSYLRGHWSSIILPAGFGPGRAQVYGEWRADKRVTNWSQSEASGRSINLGINTRGLHRFLELSDDPTWERPIASAINWYVESNAKAGGIQGAIVLQMAALELLAWTLFVRDAIYGRYSASEYNNSRVHPLSRKLHHLLEWMGVSSEISEVQYPHLRVFAQPHGLVQDAPQILAGIRNAYVHPNRQDFIETASVQVINDAYKLGQRYLKEVLQKLFGYVPFLPIVRRAR